MHAHRQLLHAVEQIPFAGDLLLQEFIFKRRKTACRGVFESYQAAKSYAERFPVAGYDQTMIVGSENPAYLTASGTLGDLNDRDYPVLFHLNKIIAGQNKLFNLGGNVGLEYYAYRKQVDLPSDLNWIICEIDNIVKAGRAIAEREGAHQLSFTTDFADCSGSDTLLSCGTLQYIEARLHEMLAPLPEKPTHILLNRIPLYDGPTFYTLQNIGYSICPYRVENTEELVASMATLGYRKVASWKDSRLLRIPFHGDRTVTGYSGLYFRRES